MENASKALIMAGSLLIALIILGALLLMFNNLSSYQDSTDKNEKEAQIVEFNNQYETYNRTDVRGSDLYSLLNRVVDYNRRKSEKATGDDEGQDTKFQAMTIKVDFPNDNQIKSNWTYDNEIRLFDGYLIKKDITGNKLELTEKTSNQFYETMNKKIKDLEKKYGGQSGINNLASGMSKLFQRTKCIQ